MHIRGAADKGRYAMAGRRNWTEQEYLAALVLYLTVPSGRHDSNNMRIKELAAAIGRTPSSVVTVVSDPLATSAIA